MTITVETMVQQIKDMSDGGEYVYVCDEYSGVVKVIRKVLMYYVGYIETVENYYVHEELMDDTALVEYLKAEWVVCAQQTAR